MSDETKDKHFHFESFNKDDKAKTIDDCYELVQGSSSSGAYELGRGGFAEVYLGRDLRDGKIVALKYEKGRNPDNSHLLNELKIYKALGDSKSICKVFHYEQYSYTKRVMAFEYIGPCLKHLYRFCNRHFDAITIAKIAIQCVRRLEDVHNAGFIHNDIKPENFCIGYVPGQGRKESDQQKHESIYIIDFGMSFAYVDADKQHFPRRRAKKIAGTARYASLNTHNAIVTSRRDDLFCLGYMLLYLLRGSLPWQSITGPNLKEKWRLTKKMKLETSLRQLCSSVKRDGLRLEISSYMKTVNELEYAEEPDYDYLCGVFEQWLRRYKRTNEIAATQRLAYCWESNLHMDKRIREIDALVGPKSKSTSRTLKLSKVSH